MAFGLELPQAVGPGAHRLGPQGLRLEGGRHLRGHHAPQVVRHGHFGHLPVPAQHPQGLGRVPLPGGGHGYRRRGGHGGEGEQVRSGLGVRRAGGFPQGGQGKEQQGGAQQQPCEEGGAQRPPSIRVSQVKHLDYSKFGRMDGNIPDSARASRHKFALTRL